MSHSRSATAPSITAADSGVAVGRRFTEAGVHPFDAIEWEIRDALIGDPAKPAFEQHGVEFPATWSQNATNIVAQKYFRGRMDSPEREHSVKQMIARVAGTIAGWGREGGYFASDEDAQAFEDELTHILLNQMAAFNSPVWFNVGFEEHPQCSACFILSVEDTIESILDWNTKEGMIFRGGSGSGINLSRIRASKEHLSKGGLASGPVSFMRGADAWAGTIKSGGKTRRAAKMVVLDVDHPGHPRLHLVQGARGGEGGRAARRRLRHAPRQRALRLDPVPERQQLGARQRRVHGARRARRGLGAHRARGRRRDRARQRARAAGAAGRGGLALRRPGRPVRHHDQRLAHLPELGSHQRLQPVLGVHARRRLGLQPRLDQPDEVPPRGRLVRRRRLRARRRRDDPRAGDRRLAVELPDRGDRPQRARLPPARPRLRQPRRAADGQRPRLRLRGRPGALRRDHRADDRPRLPHLGRGRRGDGAVRASTSRTATRTTT